MTLPPYRLRVLRDPDEVDGMAWDALLQTQDKPTPFFTHAYLRAMHTSQSAVSETGWQMLWLLLESAGEIKAATQLSIKTHSYGEYVFDWAWANAYQHHGLNYYPKAVVASPFTPVPSSRLLAVDDAARLALVMALQQFCQSQGLGSLHLLFLSAADAAACKAAGLMQRQNVQFHWLNAGYASHADYLAGLAQDKRKKVRAEMRKVADAGVSWTVRQGEDIGPQDWAFFYRCYAQTYAEHGNPPYITPAFFEAMQGEMSANWVMFLARREGRLIASSLIAVDSMKSRAIGQFDAKTDPIQAPRAYGRYWGALERVDCLHFDACYHQPIVWCIQNGIAAFEGGAQGEHKMARGLLPTPAFSAHWLAHPQFSAAVERFLEREGEGVERYMDELREHQPFKRPVPLGI